MTDPANKPSSSDGRLARCRILIHQRRQLAKIMGEIPCDSPFVDMLLNLYLAELEARDLCQSGIESRASRASAHRHFKFLFESGMAVRAVDPTDLRRRTVKLAGHMRRALDNFMDELPSP